MCAGHRLYRHPTSEVGWPLRAGRRRCRHATSVVGWLSCVGHGLCGQATSDIGRLMCEGYGRCWQVMCTVHGRCGQSTTNVAWSICTGHGRCGQSTTNVAWPITHVVSWRRLPDIHMPRQMRAGLGWWCMSLGRRRLPDVRWQQSMSPSRCVYITVGACKPWPISPAVERCAQVMTDVAQPMRTGHGWYVHACCMLLADVVCQMRTHHGWSVQAFADARKPRPVTPSRCAHAPADAWIPWLMMHALGRRRLPDAHTPRFMQAYLGRCRLPLADARRPRPLTPSRCAHATAYECRP